MKDPTAALKEAWDAFVELLKASVSGLTDFFKDPMSIFEKVTADGILKVIFGGAGLVGMITGLQLMGRMFAFTAMAPLKVMGFLFGAAGTASRALIHVLGAAASGYVRAVTWLLGAAGTASRGLVHLLGTAAVGAGRGLVHLLGAAGSVGASLMTKIASALGIGTPKVPGIGGGYRGPMGDTGMGGAGAGFGLRSALSAAGGLTSSFASGAGTSILLPVAAGAGVIVGIAELTKLGVKTGILEGLGTMPGDELNPYRNLGAGMISNLPQGLTQNEVHDAIRDGMMDGFNQIRMDLPFSSEYYGSGTTMADFERQMAVIIGRYTGSQMHDVLP